MKKAFTSAFSSFTDKLKNKMDGTDSDDLETMSIRTDTSDDDFEHLSLDDFGEEVPAFLHHDQPQADTASVNDNYSDLGDPGDSVSMYAESSTTKGKEMVSALPHVNSELKLSQFLNYALSFINVWKSRHI